MNNYLFFRTDRIGDFLLSAILINSVKRNDPTSHVTVVCSSKNYDYIKNFNIVDEAVLYPEGSFLEKIYFIKRIFFQKRYCTIVCDGKKRSIYSAILSRSKIKILFTTKTLYKRILKSFFSKILVDVESDTKILEIKNVINYLNFNFSDTDLKTIIINKSYTYNKKFDPIEYNNSILLHFDEKWIFNDYIKSYTSIEPSIDQLFEFIFKIISTTKKNLIITTGINNNDLLDKLKSKLEKFNDFIHLKKINFNYIYLVDKLSFFDVQFLVSKSNLIITSHGAITHVAGSLNIPIFDIIDKTENLFFHKWSSHFKTYSKFYRKDFEILSKEIVNSL